MKQAGILMPLASLPSSFGVGDFGENSYEFIRLIKKCGFKIWQLLPLNPLGYGNSPYQPYSSKAMDELYIDLFDLVNRGYLTEITPFNQDSLTIDFDAVREYKSKYLQHAFTNFIETEEYIEFIQQQWVLEYAMFISLKKNNNNQCWLDWIEVDCDWSIHRGVCSASDEQVRYELFLQYILFSQWKQLRNYANELGIQIMGDIPIYVGLDSVEVYCNREVFLLDSKGHPTFIAGVPPDYFSATGQRWGNPLYDWDYLEKTNFAFWISRLEYNQRLFDCIRIDHFRAFDTYWKIPATCPTAMDGEWEEAPGYKLFDTIYKELPTIQLVAEDLGLLREEVHTLRDHYNLMGMRILQYDFFPPQRLNYRRHVIVYAGTHDNESLKGWYSNKNNSERLAIHRYLKKYRIKNPKMIDKLLQLTLNTNASIVICSLFDYLHKDNAYRINKPGIVDEYNWRCRIVDFTEFRLRIREIKKLLKNSNRLN